jgi:NADPH:quinone reductase-like Zn-dependent oxidoreductase
MKAIVYERYGGPEVLRLAELGKPVPAADQVLVRVQAASVNPLDWHFMRGEPYIVRLMAGLRRPREQRLGRDLAGVVEAVGSQMTAFQPGDRVFGADTGAFAEFACATVSTLARMPENLSFEEAAAVPVAALTALQALRDKGNLQTGQRVLVNGASGGVGSFAVQIAMALGARVTAVTSTRNLEWDGRLGAERMIDYTREDFTAGPADYDLLLDCVGTRGLRDRLRVLKPGGSLVVVGGKPGNWIGPLAGMAKVLALGPFVRQKLTGMLARINAADLEVLCSMLASGAVRPVLDRAYPLAETAEAIRYLEQGHARGKVVIHVEQPG